MCHYIKKDNWTRGWSREHQVPYAYKDTQWVGYDDEESIKIKVDYIIKYCLGGAMVWSIDLDDFKNICSDKPYPLTRLISVNLKERDRKKCTALNKIKNDKDIDQYLREIVKWVPSSTEIEDTSEDKYQSFFTTIHANLMCFFANERDYNDLNATSYPINLYNCKLNKLEDTTIQRNVIHLETIDNAEYLFDAAGDDNDQDYLDFWFNKILEASGKYHFVFF